MIHAEHPGASQAGVIRDLVLLACVGVRPVLVHGGGPEINSWLGKLGIEAEFKNGLRVTDGAPHPINHFHLRVMNMGHTSLHYALPMARAGILKLQS